MVTELNACCVYLQVVAATMWPLASCVISTPSPSMSLMTKPWPLSSATSWSGIFLQSRVTLEVLVWLYVGVHSKCLSLLCTDFTLQYGWVFTGCFILCGNPFPYLRVSHASASWMFVRHIRVFHKLSRGRSKSALVVMKCISWLASQIIMIICVFFLVWWKGFCDGFESIDTVHRF